MIDGAAPGDRILAEPCGDINGDGLEDLAVEATREGRLVAYVVYGKDDEGPVELAELEAGGAGGLVFDAGARLPYSDEHLERIGVGDVNGDGFDDLVVAPRHSDAGSATAGRRPRPSPSATSPRASAATSSRTGRRAATSAT